MIRRVFTRAGVLLLLLVGSGCAYTESICPNNLRDVRPSPAQALNGTYADHSPSVFGGSIWEMLTGEHLDSPGVVHIGIQALPGKKLAVTRVVNGIETARRVVPYWIEHGYVRVSRSKWWTLLLMSNIEWNESALSRRGDELLIYHDWGYVLFVTLMPIVPDTGPPPYWHNYPAAASTATSRAAPMG